MVPKSKTAQVQLENGKAVTTVKTVSGDDKLTRNYTLNFTNQANAIPAADPAVGTASLMVGDTYHLYPNRWKNSTSRAKSMVARDRYP